MTRRAAVERRFLHPGAWWLWAACGAVAALRTTNPLLLGLLRLEPGACRVEFGGALLERGPGRAEVVDHLGPAVPDGVEHHLLVQGPVRIAGTGDGGAVGPDR